MIRDPIETGKDGSAHLMPQATTSFCNHVPASTPQYFAPSAHEIISSNTTTRAGHNPLGWRVSVIVLFR